MAAELEGLDIVKTIADFGLSSILLYFLFIVWKDRKEMVAAKDGELQGLQKEVMNVIRENTKTQEALRATIAESIKQQQTSSDRIYDELRDLRNKR